MRLLALVQKRSTTARKSSERNVFRANKRKVFKQKTIIDKNFDHMDSIENASPLPQRDEASAMNNDLDETRNNANSILS